MIWDPKGSGERLAVFSGDGGGSDPGVGRGGGVCRGALANWAKEESGAQSGAPSCQARSEELIAPEMRRLRTSDSE